mgnify:CR=1 FL=1
MAMKIIKVKNKDVSVTTGMSLTGPHVRLRAECEGVVREHTWTIGPEEGFGPAQDDYDQVKLQRDLDSRREEIAREAEFHARVKNMMKFVV